MKPTSLPLVLAVTSMCTTLTACSSAKSGAIAAVRENLKDPDSARFGDFYYNDKTKKACLTVNAKNSMGGYTGDQQVRLTRTDEGWSYGSEEEEDQDTCKRYFADATE